VLHVVGVVGRAVVEEQGDGLLPGGLYAVLEGGADGGAVLLGRDRHAHGGVARRVDDELEVHAVALLVDGDLERLAVADPLGPWKEGLEGVAERVLITRAPSSSLRRARAMREEDVRDHRTPQVEA